MGNGTMFSWTLAVFLVFTCLSITEELHLSFPSLLKIHLGQKSNPGHLSGDSKIGLGHGSEQGQGHGPHGSTGNAHGLLFGKARTGSLNALGVPRVTTFCVTEACVKLMLGYEKALYDNGSGMTAGRFGK